MPADDLQGLPHDFSSIVRLFPLPNLVFFPQAMQPLRIFEPRYKALMEDALETDRLIAMAVLAPGWEAEYEGRPPLAPMACLGRVATWHRLENGDFNLLLTGICRVRLVEELPPERPFRRARVQVCPDMYPQSAQGDRHALHRALLEAFKGSLPKAAALQEAIGAALASKLTLGALADVIAHTLDMGLEIKEQLLRETEADARARRLLEFLQARASGATAVPPFPPDFSRN